MHHPCCHTLDRPGLRPGVEQRRNELEGVLLERDRRRALTELRLEVQLVCEEPILRAGPNDGVMIAPRESLAPPGVAPTLDAQVDRERWHTRRLCAQLLDDEGSEVVHRQGVKPSASARRGVGAGRRTRDTIFRDLLVVQYAEAFETRILTTRHHVQGDPPSANLYVT
eukprot:4779606-Prymnesium_polylepis.1